MQPFKNSQEFARSVHRDQQYGASPYSRHLEDIDDVLVRFGFALDFELRIAGQLHDVIEDTRKSSSPVTVEDLVLSFGEKVAALVDAVTDGEGKNRKERKKRPIEMMKKLRRAIIVKLADRIANFERSVLTADTNSSLLDMYVKEHDGFVKELRDPDDGIEPMWDHLEYLVTLARFIKIGLPISKQIFP